VDEGEAMQLLMVDCTVLIEKQKPGGSHPSIGYVNRLLAAFSQPMVLPHSTLSNPAPLRSGDDSQHSAMVESLSPRELEVLRLIAQGLSNQEIADRLFLALNTVKGYTRTLFDKLQVQRRTEAIVRARELGLL